MRDQIEKPMPRGHKYDKFHDKLISQFWTTFSTKFQHDRVDFVALITFNIFNVIKLMINTYNYSIKKGATREHV